MIGHEFDSNLNIVEVKGQAFVVLDDARIIVAQPGMDITQRQVLLTSDNSTVDVLFGGKNYQIDSQCASCIIARTENDQPILATTKFQTTFDGDKLNSDLPSNIDVKTLHHLIQEGADLTKLFEEAEEAEKADVHESETSSANAGFIIVDYLYKASLTHAGFETQSLSLSDEILPEFEGNNINKDDSDVDAIGGQKVSLSTEEGDLDNGAYEDRSTAAFKIDAGSERLLPDSLQIAPSELALFESELENITSGGKQVVFTRQSNLDENGVGTFTLVGTVDSTVVITLTLTATQVGDGLSVTATSVQTAPLDHLSSTGTYININGESITINMPLQAVDVGGDFLQKPVQITIVSNDGAAPVVDTASVEITEPQNNSLTATKESTSEGIDLGSDNIGKIEFDATAAELAFSGIKVHGEATTVDATVDGIITVYIAGTSDKVLEVSLKAPDSIGETAVYQVTQYSPIDQDEDISGDTNHQLSTFTLPFKVFDFDGDVSNTSQVTFTIHDGVPTSGGEHFSSPGILKDYFTINEHVTSQDQSPSNTEDETVEIVAFSNSANPETKSDVNAVTGTVEIIAASDKLRPETLSIEGFNAFEAELMELKNNADENIDTVSSVRSIDANGNTVITVTASINGVTALQFVFTAVQPSGSLNVNVDVEFHQYQPLHHPKDPSVQQQEGNVTADEDIITIKVPIQIKDTDGNSLIDPNVTHDASSPTHLGRVITFAIHDDNLGTVHHADTIQVDESSIGAGTGINQGSNATSGTLNVDTTNDNGDPNSLDVNKVNGDTLHQFYLETDYVVYPNGQPVLASGYPVFLEQRSAGSSYPITYVGYADDASGSGDTRDVFSVVLAEDGTFTFELLSALDHADGDGINTLSFNLIGHGIDADGDISNGIPILITVTDDIPRTQNSLTLEVDDTAMSASVDVFTIKNPSSVPGINDLQGADSGTFLTKIHNGIEWIVISTTRPTQLDIFDTSNPSIKLGSVDIDPRTDPVGQITFTAISTNSTTVINQTIQYEVTDFDGDKAEGSIALTITDTNTGAVSRTMYHDSEDDVDPAKESDITEDGDNIINATLGDDILVGGASDEIFEWTVSSIDGSLNTDVVVNFELSNTMTGDQLDISDILPASVASGSTVEEFLDYILPEVTEDGLTLHISQTENGIQIQDIVLSGVGLSELGLATGVTGAQILDELLQYNVFKFD